MGGSGGGTQRVIQDLPEWSRPYWSNIARRGRALSAQPYQEYLGPRIAGFDPQERQAFQGVQSLYEAGPRQELDAATALAGSAGIAGSNVERWGSDAYRQYANPYIENVTALGRQRIEDSYRDMLGDRLRGTRDDALRAGVVGGRGTLADARVASDVSEEAFRNLREYEAEQGAAAYEQAMNAFEGDRQAQFQGAELGLTSAGIMRDLAQTQQEQALQRIAALQESGMTQRDMENAIRQLAYQDFIDRRDWGRQQLNWYTGLLSGTPYNVTDQTTGTNVQGPSAGQIGLGLGIAGLGAAGEIWG